MNTNTILIVLVALLLVLNVVQGFQVYSIKNELTGNVVKSSDGETYDEMMERMHPELSNAQNAPQMVGGC